MKLGPPAWVTAYQRGQLPGDLIAALVVTMLLVPQGLAYASLAGLPPQLGLYASVLPMVAYALFGTSMVLSVGPVAVTALMTASALTPIAAPGSPEYVAGAIVLALLSGLMLFAFGMLRLGQLARLLSHPVINGFISGAAILIIIGQLRPLFGIQSGGDTAVELIWELLRSAGSAQLLTSALGLAALLLLWIARRHLAGWLERAGMAGAQATLLSRMAPMAVVLLAAAGVAAAGLADRMAVVGDLPTGLPQLVWPALDWSLLSALWLPALIISLITFVESVAIAQAFARQAGTRIDPNAELRGLGAANLASAFSGAFPVTGGFSRTVVNAEAGARTPLAGILAAGFMVVVLLFATGVFRSLPNTVLAAVIIIAALSLVDVKGLKHAWHFDRLEGMAFGGTALGVLLAGVEAGVVFGVVFSLALLVWRASHPHLAVMGRMPGSEHFRNVLRHPEVECHPDLIIVRVDENLFFGNAEGIEERLFAIADDHPDAKHLILVMSSVSHVDATAADMLEYLNATLSARGVRLHLAEVKGPVMDRLEAGTLLGHLSGEVFLSTHAAVCQLSSAGR
ncbi:MAG: SulP family inorganic anion transporter [Gammaproteobacteria bacterium]|nr:SulP family inorganic anion transporter [Gammaproteobacteria bacterium]